MTDKMMTKAEIQHVFDGLQAALMRVQRLGVVARQQQIDAAESVASLERVIATVQSAVRAPGHENGGG